MVFCDAYLNSEVSTTSERLKHSAYHAPYPSPTVTLRCRLGAGGSRVRVPAKAATWFTGDRAHLRSAEAGHRLAISFPAAQGHGRFAQS